MKLREFVNELEIILKQGNGSEEFEVRMADYIPVVKPKCIDGVVYVTDVE